MSNQGLTRRQWMFCAAAVLGIKFALLLLDPLPMFFLGDSQTYLHTALHLSIPLDRSFTYGLFVRLAAVTTGSLFTLVLFQVLLSAGSALILIFLLVRCLGTGFRTALLLGILCALEPLQLLYERYVLTETLSLFIFALYLLCAFLYLESRSYAKLAAIQILGTALITVRLSFLPIILCFAAVIPLLHLLPSSRAKGGYELGTVGRHLAFSLILTLCFHSAYKHLNGYLVKAPSAAYQYQSGMFLAADFAPVMTPADFPNPGLAPAVFSSLLFDLHDRNARGPQRWMDGGLIARINMIVPDPFKADATAKATALNTLKRDPLGVCLLAVQGYGDYWNRKILQRSMVTDKGNKHQLPPEMLRSLKNDFALDGENLPMTKTLTGTYFFKAWPWYLFLLCLPAVAIPVLCFTRTGRDRLFLVFLATSALVLTASLLIERPTVRYLHPIGWLFFLLAGPVLNNVTHIFSRKELQR